MPSRFADVINKEISQLIKQTVPQIHEEGGEVRFGSFKALSFWLQFINKTGEKVFCLQIQIKVKSCVTLFSWLVHNKLLTKFNNLFYRMILNTKRIQNSFRRNFPARAKQMQEKATAGAVRSLRAKIVIVGNSIWDKNHHFCAQLSHDYSPRCRWLVVDVREWKPSSK